MVLVAATVRAQACRRWQHLSGLRLEEVTRRGTRRGSSWKQGSSPRLRHVHDLETPRLRHVHDLETPRLRHVHDLEVSDICAGGAAMEDSASATVAGGGIDGYTGSCVGGNSISGSIGATASARGG
jgi:hypothetical protein